MDQVTNGAELRKGFADDVDVRTMQVRASGEADALVLEGYAAVFNTETTIGRFREQMAPGCFDDVMADDVRLLINHDGLPLARTANGTLQMETDDHGLKFRAELPDTQDARDLHKLVTRGDVSQCSFAFYMGDQTVDRSDGELPLHTVTRVKSLLDLSVVTYPAYNSASVVARSEDSPKKEIDTPPKGGNLHTSKHGKMNLNELRGLRAQKSEEHTALLDTIEKEGRDLTEGEVEIATELSEEVQKLDRSIEVKSQQAEMRKRIAATANVSGVASTSEARDIQSVNAAFSLTRAIGSVVNNRHLTGAELEWQVEAQREMRSVPGGEMVGQIGIPNKALNREFQSGAGAGIVGNQFVATDVPGVIEALNAPTVVESLGTTVIRNASGNIQLPRTSTKSTIAAIDINDVSADDGELAGAAGMVVEQLELTPNRIGAYETYAKSLLLQGGAAVDAIIARDLAAQLNAYVDDAAFDAALAGVGSTTGTLLTGELAAAMEAAVLAAGGNLDGSAYALSPTAYQYAKVSERVDAVSSTWDLSTNSFNGYRAVPTPYLVDSTGPTGQVVFGNWAQGLIMAFWGGIDLEVNQFSQMRAQKIELHINRFYDVAVRQAAALTKATLLTSGAYA